MLQADLIAEAHAAYARDGYAVLRGAFSATEVATIAAGFDRQWRRGLELGASYRHGNLHYRLGDDPALGRVVRMVQWPSYQDPGLARFRTHAVMLQVLEGLLGRDIKQIINQLHWKPPGAVQADFAFHQDVRFRRPRHAFRHLERSFVQTGIAVDPHTARSGAMKMLPGSHRSGEIELVVPGRVMDAAMAEDSLRHAGLDPSGLIDLELEPGDLAFWSPFAVHGSGSNRSGQDRRFYLNGYVRAVDCDRGEWAFRDGEPCALGAPVLVHYEQLHERPEPHFVEP